MKLVVGLGNPGSTYNNTRHNIGFSVIDNYLGNVKWIEKNKGLYFEKNINGEKVLFLKPQTFMNLSGESVSKFVNFYKIDPTDILIVHDDLDLSIGSYRIKYDSSSGGHNGIKSIISCIGTQKFCRLKIGVSNEIKHLFDVKDFVLNKFSSDELTLLSDKQAVFNDIINDFATNSCDYLMNKYN